MDINKTQETVIEVRVGKVAKVAEPEEDDEDESHYLSQRTNEHESSHSQIYMTPAESWQTLRNDDTDSGSYCPVIDFRKGPIYGDLDVADDDQRWVIEQLAIEN
jgi:hypothetical protein